MKHIKKTKNKIQTTTHKYKTNSKICSTNLQNKIKVNKNINKQNEIQKHKIKSIK